METPERGSLFMPTSPTPPLTGMRPKLQAVSLDNGREGRLRPKPGQRSTMWNLILIIIMNSIIFSLFIFYFIITHDLPLEFPASNVTEAVHK